MSQQLSRYTLLFGPYFQSNQEGIRFIAEREIVRFGKYLDKYLKTTLRVYCIGDEFLRFVSAFLKYNLVVSENEVNRQGHSELLIVLFRGVLNQARSGLYGDTDSHLIPLNVDELVEAIPKAFWRFLFSMSDISDEELELAIHIFKESIDHLPERVTCRHQHHPSVVNRQNTILIILMVLYWVENLSSPTLRSTRDTNQLIRELFQRGQFSCLFIRIQDLVRIVVQKIRLRRPLNVLLPFMVIDQAMISYVRGNPFSLVGCSSVMTGFLRLTARQKRRLASFFGVICEK